MYCQLFKRVIDIFVAMSLLFLLLPVFLIVSVLIRIFLGAPIIFSQDRPGLYGKPFRLLKFRTMLHANDQQGFPLSDEKRLTRFGKFLRSVSVDELPELWNVLKGEMSLVGPRPLLMEYLPYYSAQQRKRHNVRPGITGWAQINGRNSLTWEKKFDLDLWYVDNYSFALDCKILFLTIYKILKREGISAQGEATMTRFDLEVKEARTKGTV